MKIRCWTEGQPMSKFDQSIWSSTAPTFYQSPPTQKVRTPEVEFHVNFFNPIQFLHSSYELLAGSKLSYLNPGDSVEQKPGTNSHFLSADTSGIILKVHMSKNTQNSHGNHYTKLFGWAAYAQGRAAWKRGASNRQRKTKLFVYFSISWGCVRFFRKVAILRQRKYLICLFFLCYIIYFKLPYM